METFENLLILIVIVWLFGKLFRNLKLPIIFGELLILLADSANVDRDVRQLILAELKTLEGLTSPKITNLLQKEVSKRTESVIEVASDSDKEPDKEPDKEFLKKPFYAFLELKNVNNPDIQEAVEMIDELFATIVENNKEYSILTGDVITASLKAGNIMNKVIKTSDGICDELLERFEKLEAIYLIL